MAKTSKIGMLRNPSLKTLDCHASLAMTRCARYQMKVTQHV